MRILAALTLAVLVLRLPSHAQSMCNGVSNSPLVMQMLCGEPPKAQAVPATLRASLPKQPVELQPITAEAINHMRLIEAPPIGSGDVLTYEANRTDFVLELFFGNGKEIVIQPLTRADAENIEVHWKHGETKLDYPETLNQPIIRMRIRTLHQVDAPLLLRSVKIIRNGQTIAQLQVTHTGPNQPPFEPPMSYAPDPMLPNPHITNVSISRSDLSSRRPETGFLAPKLPSYSINPMVFQSTTTSTGDPNNYKFNGKELDAETGLYNFGARYYSPALGRYMSPDWSARPTTVPYADLSNPQTLNLYTYGKNNPTTIADKDGHCAGDDCKNVKVEVKATENAKIVQNERQSGGDYATGVRAKVQYTLTENGKPLSNIAVDEKNSGKRTLNGQERPGGKLNEQSSETNSKGQLNDTFGLMAHSDTPLSAEDNKGFVDVLSNNSVTVTGTQTLTFQDQEGTTCSCTVDRTLTNENKNGTNNGSNYNFTTSQPSAAKPAEKPKEKQQQ